MTSNRINSGIYQVSGNGKSVEIRRLDANKQDGVSACWMTVIDGEYDMDFSTKREAMMRAEEICND